MPDKIKPVDVEGLLGYLEPGFRDAREILAEKNRCEADVNDTTPIIGNTTATGIRPD